MYNVESNFPTNVDDLIYYSDTDLDHLDMMKKHNELIIAKKYTEASEFINSQDGIHGHFSCLYNLIGNRLHKLQVYLDKKAKINPFHFTSEEPEISEGEFWI